MNITTTQKHTLTFRVYACWNEEGGMGEDSFGGEESTLEKALVNLQLARIHNSKEEWFIRCEVTTNVTKD